MWGSGSCNSSNIVTCCFNRDGHKSKGSHRCDVLCILPMLEHFHIEAFVRKAVEQHIRPKEFDQLINGPMQHFAQAVWGGHFDAIKRRLLGFLVAPESLHGSGLCFKRAIMNFSLPECKTLPMFYSGDICLTSTSTVDCLEFPQPGFVSDGTPTNLRKEETSRDDVGKTKTTLGLLFNVG